LTVTKTTTCNPQEFGDICNVNYDFAVNGNNPTPSIFTASDTPIVVTLDAGAYSVIQSNFEPGLAQCAGFDGGQQIEPNTYTCTNLSDDCSGDISIGEELTCNIENTVIDVNVPPETATLNVTKLVTFDDQNGENSPSCADLLGNITEDQFNIQVFGDNAVPGSFAGSEAGTTVTLNAGPYQLNDTALSSVATDIESLGGNITGPIPSFTGNCQQQGSSSVASATIAGGASENCAVENHFVIEEETACDACFARLDSNTQNAINDLLETIPDGGIFLSTPRITIPVEVNSTEKLCEFFNNIPTITVTSTQRVALILEFAHSSTSQRPAATAIIDCLEEVGKIIVNDTPPV
jgi:hypothetical protein